MTLNSVFATLAVLELTMVSWFFKRSLVTGNKKSTKTTSTRPWEVSLALAVTLCSQMSDPVRDYFWRILTDDIDFKRCPIKKGNKDHIMSSQSWALWKWPFTLLPWNLVPQVLKKSPSVLPIDSNLCLSKPLVIVIVQGQKEQLDSRHRNSLNL